MHRKHLPPAHKLKPSSEVMQVEQVLVYVQECAHVWLVLVALDGYK